MNPEAQFRVVMRGYEPAQVDRALAEQDERARTAEQAAEQLAVELEKAQIQIEEANRVVKELREVQAQPPAEPPRPGVGRRRPAAEATP